MRRWGFAGFALALVAGALVLVVAGVHAKRPALQDLGVIPNGPVLLLDRGKEACQTPIGLAPDVRRVSVVLGPFTATLGPIDVSIRKGDPDGPTLGSASVARGPLPSGPTTVELDRTVEGDQDVALCVRNRGRTPLELIGDIDSSARPLPSAPLLTQGSHPSRSTDDLEIDGRPLGGRDLSASFPAADPNRSLIDAIPSAFRYASTFKLAGIGAWTWWILLVLVVIIAPLLLLRGLGAALRQDDDG